MSGSSRRIGVLLINFGEPREPVADAIQPFLERIFLQNAGLEPDQAARERAHTLAMDRTPGLIEQYRLIGGSPLNEQSDRQALELREILQARGWSAETYSAFQFVAPFVHDRVRDAMDEGVELLVALPVYPLCGRSTTVAALEAVDAALSKLDWHPTFVGMSGWHHHPSYIDLRTDHIRDFVAREGLDLNDADTLLYFSVHGTPVRYLNEGSRYDRYVEEQCRTIAEQLGVDRYAVGFQNHTNRRITWTQPDNEDRIRAASEAKLVVVPISFMHEQSETLAELDHGLREFTESLGKRFHRVPVPHDVPDFASFLADLVEALVAGPAVDFNLFGPCRCTPLEGIRCTNGHRELPPSPFAPTIARVR